MRDFKKMVKDTRDAQRAFRKDPLNPVLRKRVRSREAETDKFLAGHCDDNCQDPFKLAVRAMREAQRRYFSKNRSDGALSEMARLERGVDKLLAAHEKSMAQPTLF